MTLPVDPLRRRLLAASAALVAAPLRAQPHSPLPAQPQSPPPAQPHSPHSPPPALPRWPHPTLNGAPPLVIAHRGASGYRPEHTLAAYELAIEQGADFIEPDLVVTRDGALVARHENELSLTTDVAARPEFAARRRTQRVDGREVTGWFSEDFTLDEIRRLRARERFARERPRNAELDGRFGIATFDEVVALARRAREAGRRVGIYPELKHAQHFAALGLAPAPLLAQELKQAEGLPLYVQSFELAALQQLAEISAAPRVMLLARAPAAAELRALAQQVQGIGVAKALVYPRDAAGAIGAPTPLVAEAHALGLAVHAWTFRNEDAFLPPNLRGQPERELELFFAAGVDGVFSDFPDTAVAVRQRQAR